METTVHGAMMPEPDYAVVYKGGVNLITNWILNTESQCV